VNHAVLSSPAPFCRLLMVPKIGVLNISDRASAGVYEDTPGQACVALLREWLVTPFELDYQRHPR
jgi:molybdopterin biosynthesis enzyme MoaB